MLNPAVHRAPLALGSKKARHLAVMVIRNHGIIINFN